MKIIILLLIMAHAVAEAQHAPVRVQVTVTPPYSTKISDYTSNPHKVLVTLQHLALDDVGLRVYLRGEIAGSSGIRIYTRPGYRPAYPITLQPGTPFMLNLDNLQEVFSVNQLVYEGITEREIIYGNGLPEDDYVICLQAYAYDTGQEVSAGAPLGCSAPFTVSNLEPPVITQPLCRGPVTPLVPQNMVFSWTMPAGAPARIQYRFEMVEITPAGHDPNDALQSAAHPLFFERVTTGPVLVLGPAEPALVQGKSYAFRVTAVDPLGQRVFRNRGQSEVCSFSYGTPLEPSPVADMVPDRGTALPGVAASGGTLPPGFELAPTTEISGRLWVKFPTDPYDLMDLSTLPIPPGVIPVAISSPSEEGAPARRSRPYQDFSIDYGALSHLGVQLGGNINHHRMSSGNPTPDPEEMAIHPDLFTLGWPLLAPMNARKFVLENTENMVHIRPLPHMRIKLVARIGFIGIPALFGSVPPEFGELNPVTKGLDLNGKFRGDANNYANVTLAETTTDAHGNYTFSVSLPFWTGPVLTQSIQHAPPATTDPNPLNDRLNSVIFPGVDPLHVTSAVQQLPDQVMSVGGQQVRSMSGSVIAESKLGYLCLKIEVENQKLCSPDVDIFAMPGDKLQIPPQVAKLKTYNLTVEVKSDHTEFQINGPDKPLKGVRVSVLRDYDRIKHEVPLILAYEGHRLNTKVYSSKGEFREVGVDTTRVNGKVRIENLVRHGYIDPQYLIDLSTRNFDVVETAYDNTLYNYQDIFDELPVNAHTTAFQAFTGWVTYNHQYPGPAELAITYAMKPLPPEIKGRVMAASELENVGMANVPVYLLNQSTDTRLSDFSAFLSNCYSHREQYTYTNESGFFRFAHLPARSSGKPIYRRVYVQRHSYAPQIHPPIGLAPHGQLPYSLLWGELKDLKDINLEPVWMMPGYVEDELGKPVTAYVKSAHSPYYKTKSRIVAYDPNNLTQSIRREEFAVPAVPGGTVTLHVVPLSSQYFSRDETLVPPGSPVKVVVYQRLHRPAVTVKDEQGKVIPGAQVDIGGNQAVTDAQGTAWLKFAAAADQFVLKISPPSGYAPLQQPIDVPVSADWKHFSFVVKAAQSMRGYVTEKQSNEPVEGALVFAELLSTDGMPLYIQASTNAQGFYQLPDIPHDLNQLVVQVIREGSNPSYVGTVKTIHFPPPGQLIAPLQNFVIERLDGWNLEKIWGFPIVTTALVEKIPPGATHPAILMSGYFVNPPVAGAFSLLQHDLKIPFKNLRVVRSASNRPEPVAEQIVTEALEIPLVVAQHYTGHLYNYSQPGTAYSYFPLQGFTRKKIELEKTTFGLGGGRIQGQVKLNLGSFATAHQFSGELYAGTDTLSGKATVFSSQTHALLAPRYAIFSLDNKLKPVPVKNYRVFNFRASAELDHSYLQQSVIKLGTILHTHIPGGGKTDGLDLKIRAGDLVIDDAGIGFQERPGGHLSFDLEKWKVYSQKPWRFDINEEAIVLPEVLIVTGQGIDARVKNMKIRPSSLVEGQLDLEGGLTLGGIAPVELAGTLQPVFNYDAGVGHYRISLVGSTDQPAGRVRNLKHTHPSVLTFESIGMLSDNRDVLTIRQSFRFYDIIDMYVDQLMTGPQFFALSGRPEIGIPGYTPPTAVVTYTRTRGSLPWQTNQLVPQVEALQDTVYCRGNVQLGLDLNRQSVTPGKFTAYGDVKISPAPEDTEGVPFTLRGFLTKTKSTCAIDLITVDTAGYHGDRLQEMAVGANKILVENGRANVVGTAWDYLRYTGRTTAIEGLDTQAGPPNRLAFEVKGGIQATSDDINVRNINTEKGSSMGGMSLTYNFADASLVGSMSLNGLPLGYAQIVEGLGTVRFNQYGYYILVDLQDFWLGPTPGMPGFKGGLLVGSSKRVEESDLAHIRAHFRYELPDFDQGLVGIYVIGEKVIVNGGLNAGFTQVSAAAGLGLFVNLNFNADPTYLLGGYGYCNLFGSQTWGIPETGPDCTAWVDGSLWYVVQGGYENGQFVMTNCGSLSIAPGYDGTCGYVLNKLQLDHLLEFITNMLNVKMETGYSGGFFVDLEPFATCQ